MNLNGQLHVPADSPQVSTR